MQARIENVTPIVAGEMLKVNPNNRKLMQSRVNAMAKQMERGAWVDNGASIVMNGEMLLDGQHRLSAVQQSGVAQDFVVVRGVSRDAFASIDTGRVRSLADVLHVSGEEHASQLSSAIKHAWSIKDCGYPRRSSVKLSGMTHAEMAKFLSENPSIRSSLEFIRGMRNKLPVTIGALAAIHDWLSSIDPLGADEFFTALIDGVGIRRGSVEALLFRTLQNDMTRNIPRIASDARMQLIVRAWNHRRSGTVPSFLKQRASNSAKGGHSRFPKPQ